MPFAKSIYEAIFLTLERVFRVRFPTPSREALLGPHNYALRCGSWGTLRKTLLLAKLTDTLNTNCPSKVTLSLLGWIALFQTRHTSLFSQCLGFLHLLNPLQRLVENFSKECQSRNSLPADVNMIPHYCVKVKFFS